MGVDWKTCLDEEERCSCKWCRNEDVEDSELLVFAGELLGLSRDELVNKYIHEHKLILK